MAVVDQQIAALRRLSMQDLLAVLKRANVSYVGPELKEYLVDAVSDVVTVYGSQVVDVTATDLEEQRGTTREPLVLAEPMIPAQVEGVVGWALSRDDVQSALAGSVLRLVQNPGRRTIADSAQATNRRYYRKANPNACPFCLMLASRGAVYVSRGSASASSGRGRQQVGASFHDHCRCRVVEMSPGVKLPSLNQDLSELWGRVTKDQNGTAKVAAWNQYLRETRAIPAAA